LTAACPLPFFPASAGLLSHSPGAGVWQAGIDAAIRAGARLAMAHADGKALSADGPAIAALLLPGRETIDMDDLAKPDVLGDGLDIPDRSPQWRTVERGQIKHPLPGRL